MSRCPSRCGTSAWICGLLLVLAIGCSAKNNLSKDCAVTNDQSKSFQPRVDSFPVTVTVDNQFSSDERDSILAAVREWNNLGQADIGSDLFTIQFGSVSTELRDLDPHQCGDVMGDENHFFVVREQNQSHWNSIGFQENTPGATIRCYDGDDLRRQIIYMNPTLLHDGQLDEAFAHEFGHALGLEHSCQWGGGGANYLSCSSLTGAESSYAQAVMYPILSSHINSSSKSNSRSQNRVSSVLNSNDKIRAECVVGPT